MDIAEDIIFDLIQTPPLQFEITKFIKFEISNDILSNIYFMKKKKDDHISTRQSLISLSNSPGYPT